MSGKIDADELIKRVRENMARLSACLGPHDFKVSEKYESGMAKKYKCSRCEGTVGPAERSWYERGLAHGNRVTYFETDDHIQMVELSTRRYYLRGDKLIELMLNGPNPEWVPSTREWPLAKIIIKSVAPIAD